MTAEAIKTEEVYVSIQEELLRNRRVISLEVELAYPRIGGYKATPCSIDLNICEPPRATEFKGLWRWWMRVALATYLGSYSAAEKEVSKLLGGGENRHRQSLFTVIVKLSSKEREELTCALQDANKIYNALDKLVNKMLAVAQQIRRELESRLKEVVKDIELKLVFEPQPVLEITILAKSQDNIDAIVRDVLTKTKVISSSDKLRGDYREGPKGYRCEYKYELLCESINRLLSNSGVDTTAICNKLLQKHQKHSLADVPRYRLLLMRRRGEENSISLHSNVNQQRLEGLRKYLRRISEELALPDRVKVVIDIYRNGNIDGEKLSFAIATLLLALVLGGLGGITRRGFGSILRVKVIDHHNDVESEVKLVDEIFRAGDAENLKHNILKLVKRCTQLAKRVIGIDTESAVQGMPPVPVLTKPYFRLDVIECSCKDELELLDIIGDSCLKQKWKEECGERAKVCGGPYHTWILGLPRGQARGNRVESGYGIVQDRRTDLGRRASAIHLKMINAGDKVYILIYGFLTRDWLKRRIVHIGECSRMKGMKEVDVTNLDVKAKKDCDKECSQSSPQQGDKFVEQVFDAAFNFVSCLVKRRCLAGGDHEGERCE
jgi:CRISPR type III-B/RAMP module RAMP protein Cmr1